MNITKKSNLNLLYISVMLYTLAEIVHSYIYPMSHAFQLLQAIAAVLLIYIYIRIPKRNILSGFSMCVFYLVCFVCLATIFRGLFTPIPIGAKFLLLRGTYMFPYLLPFLMLCRIDIVDFILLYKYLLVFVIFGIFFSLVNARDFYVDANYLFNTMIGFDGYIIGRPVVALSNLLPLCFFCFYFRQWPFNIRILFIISFVLSFTSALMMGRRSNCLEPLGLLLFEIVYLYYYKASNINKIKFVFTIALIFGGIVYAIENTNLAYDFFDTFEVLTGRLDQDNRSGTEMDFYKDFSTIDWLFGRGLNGTYKSPEVSVIDSLHRTVIETGYLNIILHGGLFLLIPYVCLLLNSVYKGWFKSSNSFVKYCAVFVCYNVLWLIPGGVISLKFNYILLWMCIYVCQSKYLRNLPEKSVFENLKFK